MQNKFKVTHAEQCWETAPYTCAARDLLGKACRCIPIAKARGFTAHLVKFVISATSGMVAGSGDSCYGQIILNPAYQA
jgi:hypothetical protein